MNQAKENKALVNEVKQLSSLNSPISKEISERLNEIIVERIQSMKDRFYKFIAQSSHSPSKAMTLMSSEASISKRPRIEDADAHLKFWTDHFKLTDSYNHTPTEQSRITDYFLSFINDKVLSSEDSSWLSREITTEEVEVVIKESPCNSSSGMDGIPYRSIQVCTSCHDQSHHRELQLLLLKPRIFTPVLRYLFHFSTS